MTSKLHPGRRSQPRKAMAGFSMIEALVSILVISLGILGTSSLLIQGMSNAKTASLRSAAALQASSLAAAMYTNRAFWAARTGAISFSSNSTGTVSNASSNFDTSKSSCSLCTPAQLAGLDITNWASSLANSLPEAKSEVSCPATTPQTGNNCTIKISWNERFINSGKNTSTASSATAGERSYFLHVEP